MLGSYDAEVDAARLPNVTTPLAHPSTHDV
jgi:hypothetical protein